MNKKKILHITSSFMPPKTQRDISFINDVSGPEEYTGARVGGISNIVDQLATHLDECEHHVLLRQHVDYVRGSAFNFKGRIAHDVRENVTVHHFPLKGNLSNLEEVDYTLAGLLSHDYEDFKFDTIVTHVVEPGQDLTTVDKKARWVNCTHGSKKNYDLSQRYLELIDHMHIMSEWQLSNPEKGGVKDPSKVILLGHGVDTKLFKPTDDRDSDCVWHGRISDEKQILPFSRYFEDQCSDKMLYIIGGPDHPVHVRGWKQPKNVGMCGRLFDNILADNLSAHENYVLPSRYETFCAALVEGIACCGKAYANYHDSMEWAKDVVVFSNSHMEMCENINKGTAKDVNGYEFIKENYSWDALAPKYYEMYNG